MNNPSTNAFVGESPSTTHGKASFQNHSYLFNVYPPTNSRFWLQFFFILFIVLLMIDYRYGDGWNELIFEDRFGDGWHK